MLTLFLGDNLASDELYSLEMMDGEERAKWKIVPAVGPTPGSRHGHSMVFSNPHVLLFGGCIGKKLVSDVWCLSIDKTPKSWIKLDCGQNIPAERAYHTAALCQTGSASGVMVCFGGRDGD
jgi:protein phosphatase